MCWCVCLSACFICVCVRVCVWNCWHCGALTDVAQKPKGSSSRQKTLLTALTRTAAGVVVSPPPLPLPPPSPALPTIVLRRLLLLLLLWAILNGFSMGFLGIRLQSFVFFFGKQDTNPQLATKRSKHKLMKSCHVVAACVAAVCGGLLNLICYTLGGIRLP